MKSDILKSKKLHKLSKNDIVFRCYSSYNIGEYRIHDLDGHIGEEPAYRLGGREGNWEYVAVENSLFFSPEECFSHYINNLKYELNVYFLDKTYRVFNNRKEESKMNDLIIEMFPVTKDAVLVDKWFGSKIENDPLTRMLIKGKEEELLQEATRLEEEKKNESKNS